MAAPLKTKEKVADIQGAATVDWSPLGDMFIKYVSIKSAQPDIHAALTVTHNFRKYVNYNLSWQVNLAENHVAMAPYGGPVGKEGGGGGVLATKPAPRAGSHFVSVCVQL